MSSWKHAAIVFYLHTFPFCSSPGTSAGTSVRARVGGAREEQPPLPSNVRATTTSTATLDAADIHVHLLFFCRQQLIYPVSPDLGSHGHSIFSPRTTSRPTPNSQTPRLSLPDRRPKPGRPQGRPPRPHQQPDQALGHDQEHRQETRGRADGLQPPRQPGDLVRRVPPAWRRSPMLRDKKDERIKNARTNISGERVSWS